MILGIVHHRAIDALRRASVHSKRRSDDETAAERLEAPERVEEDVARRDEAVIVRNAMDVLPPDQLKVIELAYFGGFTHVEIAEMLESPVGTVKGRMRLGLKKMRETLAHGAVGSMSEHDRFAETAGAYVLGALPDDERTAYVAHLETCAACQAEVEELRVAGTRCRWRRRR